MKITLKDDSTINFKDSEIKVFIQESTLTVVKKDTLYLYPWNNISQAEMSTGLLSEQLGKTDITKIR